MATKWSAFNSRSETPFENSVRDMIFIKWMHNTRQGWGWLGIVLSCLLVGNAYAQAQFSDLKVGYVDAEAILLNAPQTQAALRTLNDEFAPRQRDFLAKQSALQEKADTYERDQSVMGEAERINLEREIRDGRRDLQRAESEFNEDLNIRRNELLATAQRAVSEQIETYASARGYDLILQNVVYHSAVVDITSDVLAYLNDAVLSGDSKKQEQ